MAPQGPNKRMTLQTRARTDSTYDWREDGEQVIACARDLDEPVMFTDDL
jgi:hypothetical protein